MDSHIIKQVADEYRAKNGNASVTTKDLTIYLLHRVDAIDGKIVTKHDCADHRKTMGSSRAHLISLLSVIVAAAALIVSAGLAFGWIG